MSFAQFTSSYCSITVPPFRFLSERVAPTGLPPFRRKLRGSDDGDRQMVDILSAGLTDGLVAVEAACNEALEQGAHSADVILNILTRRRDPAPAITIMAPDALKLRHVPIADCARYDSLRSIN